MKNVCAPRECATNSASIRECNAPFFQGRHYVEAVKKCKLLFWRVLYAALEKRGITNLCAAAGYSEKISGNYTKLV